MSDKFLAPCVIGIFLLQYGWFKCCIDLYISQSYKGDLPYNFFHKFFTTNKEQIHGEDENWPWQNNINFLTFFQFFKKISQNIQLEVLCFLWLANYIKISVRFKFHQNPMKSIVKTEFWIFLLEKNLTLEKKISSI